jgi:hypothetical protein
MSSFKLVRTPMLFVLFFCFTVVFGPSLAQAFPAGSGLLGGFEKLNVQPGCGTDRAPLTHAIEIFDNGHFRADNGRYVYTGRAKKENKKGTKLTLVLDSSSKSLNKDVLEGWVSSICGTRAVLKSTKYTKSELKLNKKKTQAVAKFRITVKGKAGGAKGEAKYSLKVRGPWTRSN